MQIALISAAPPYRGGISKQTSILVENLSKNHSVDVINYSRQYPDFLFPGKTQYLDDKSENDNSSRMIDSINPLTWFSTGNKLAKKNYDLVIFRFLNPFSIIRHVFHNFLLCFWSPFIFIIHNFSETDNHALINPM